MGTGRGLTLQTGRALARRSACGAFGRVQMGPVGGWSPERGLLVQKGASAGIHRRARNNLGGSATDHCAGGECNPPR
eukprot:10893881-Alexandrium_andersonii.AAC.1